MKDEGDRHVDITKRLELAAKAEANKGRMAEAFGNSEAEQIPAELTLEWQAAAEIERLRALAGEMATWLEVSESRWRDLGEVIAKHGSYNNAGFCTATANRLLEALESYRAHTETNDG